MIAPAGHPCRTTITDAQRRALFAWAGEHGMSIDDLRAMTPTGSISSLSFMAAHALLDRLNGREAASPSAPSGPRASATSPLPARSRPPRLKPGHYRVLTPDQAQEIERLSTELMRLYQWDRRKFCEWLEARHYAGDKSRPMTNPQSSRDGMEVIRLLRAVVMQARAAKAKSGNQPNPDTAHRRQRIAASSATT